MNVCLQCLTNTKYVKEYVLDENMWRQHLNVSNNMGRRGELMEAFAYLMEEMWTSTDSSVKPKQFKEVVGRFKEEFGGRQQQDAQEFLTFLIDGLHEETNIVLSRPYMDLSDIPKTTMEDAAESCWSFNLLRNWSLFSFMFTGLLGSELECQNCHHKSWSFEPFMSLSLPIDMVMKIPINIVLVPLSLKAPEFYLVSVLVSMKDKVQNLIDEIYANANVGLRARSANIELVLAEVSNDKVLKIFEPESEIKKLETLSKLKELYAFEIISQDYTVSSKEHIGESNTNEDQMVCVVDNKYLVYNTISSYNPSLRYIKKSMLQDPNEGTNYFIHTFNRIIMPTSTWKQYEPTFKGSPTLINLNAKMTYLDLYDQAWRSVVRYFNSKSAYTSLKACWWRSKGESKRPFVIRLVNEEGIICSRCNWREQCLGCSVLPDKEEIKLTPNDYISLDWYLDVFEEDYWEIRKIKEHESFYEVKKIIQRPLSLKEVFSKFTTPEDLENTKCETCSIITKCKKTLTISRFPIILILHLKRYNEK